MRASTIARPKTLGYCAIVQRRLVALPAVAAKDPPNNGFPKATNLHFQSWLYQAWLSYLWILLVGELFARYSFGVAPVRRPIEAGNSGPSALPSGLAILYAINASTHSSGLVTSHKINDLKEWRAELLAP